MINFSPPTTHVRRTYPPLLAGNLIRTLKEREKIRKRYKIYKNLIDELELRLLSKRCSVMTAACYNKYVVDVETVITKDPKQFWSYSKEKRGGTSAYPLIMIDGISSSSDGIIVSEILTAYFASMYS